MCHQLAVTFWDTNASLLFHSHIVIITINCEWNGKIKCKNDEALIWERTERNGTKRNCVEWKILMISLSFVEDGKKKERCHFSLSLSLSPSCIVMKIKTLSLGLGKFCYEKNCFSLLFFRHCSFSACHTYFFFFHISSIHFIHPFLFK